MGQQRARRHRNPRPGGKRGQGEKWVLLVAGGLLVAVAGWAGWSIYQHFAPAPPQVAAGAGYSCLLRGGEVRCWGDNRQGQLGDGELPPQQQTRATAVRGLQNVRSLSLGERHGCALLQSGQVSCWGDNSSGQLGNGSTRAPAGPVRVPGLRGVRQVVSGGAHSCALLTTGRASCWGDNAEGQLGDRSIRPHPRPQLVPGLSGATQLATGQAYSCALLRDGGVRCWGSNTAGQLGRLAVLRPGQLISVALPAPAKSISGGGFHVCAQLRDGGGSCWGANGYGQAGNGTRGIQAWSSSRIASPSIDQLAPGLNHVCALIAAQVSCWGQGESGQLGPYRKRPPAAAPLPRTLRLRGAVQLAAGAGYSCARLQDGGASCWGDNSSGQLGDGSLEPRRKPRTVEGLSRAIQIAAGGSYACALEQNRSVRCWGDNSSGQIAGRLGAPGYQPRPVQGLSGARELAAGARYACARTEDQVLCWGANDHSQLGNDSTEASGRPVPVSGLARTQQISAGDTHACALVNQRVRCWGDNSSGQIGDGVPTHQHACITDCAGTPSPVYGLSKVETISLGGMFGCALLQSGRVRCWGNNSDGQLGGAEDNNQVTVTVSGIKQAQHIGAGGRHACAVLKSGKLSCWGDNTYGQLGDGSTGNQWQGLPRVVVGISQVQQVVGGRDHTCALGQDRRVRCWGSNAEGQLGAAAHSRVQTQTNGCLDSKAAPCANSSVPYSARPLLVRGVAEVRSLSAGAAHTCVLLRDRRVLCWGADRSDQLGQPQNTAFSLRPLAVPGLGG